MTSSRRLPKTTIIASDRSSFFVRVVNPLRYIREKLITTKVTSVRDF